MTPFTKAVLISIFAGAMAALPFAILFTIGMDFELVVTAALSYLFFGAIASLGVGLPIALLVFRLVKSDQAFGRADVFFTANGAAIVLATILGLLGGWLSALFLGLPILLAANIYAAAGWRFVLRDFREYPLD